eukprot:scaffold40021_cov30-Tisochrysis_lutea.AAC.4
MDERSAVSTRALPGSGQRGHHGPATHKISHDGLPWEQVCRLINNRGHRGHLRRPPGACGTDSTDEICGHSDDGRRRHGHRHLSSHRRLSR